MTAQQLLTVIGSLVGLAVIAGGLYGVFKSSTADATAKRLREENADYLRRLNYIEPKFAQLEEQNKLLRELHNPTASLARLETGQDAVMKVLDEQTATLTTIERHLHPGGNP